MVTCLQQSDVSLLSRRYFSEEKKSRQNFKIPTLKYMLRILSKFPVEFTERGGGSDEETMYLDKIEEALS